MRYRRRQSQRQRQRQALSTLAVDGQRHFLLRHLKIPCIGHKLMHTSNFAMACHLMFDIPWNEVYFLNNVKHYTCFIF